MSRPTLATFSPAPRSRCVRSALALAAGFALVAGCSDSGGTGTTADYSLTLSPASVTVVPGDVTTTTVTINRTDFTGEVTLGTSGVPTGISAIFDPVTTTGTTSTLTLGVGGGTVPADYNMAVRSTSSIGDRARLLAITVAPPPPSFELSVAPAELTIAQGALAQTGVFLTRTDFTGAVTLTLIGAPAGVTGTFDPVAPTGNSSTLVLTVGAAVPPGIYDLSVTGTGSVGTDSGLLTLTVTP